jgi:hypothetical protein
LKAIRDWLIEEGQPDRLVEIENIMLLHTRNRRDNWKHTLGHLVEYAAQKTIGIRSPKRIQTNNYTFGSAGTYLSFTYDEPGQQFTWHISPSGGWDLLVLVQNGNARDVSTYTEVSLDVGWISEVDFRIRHRIVDNGGTTRTPQIYMRPDEHGGWKCSRITPNTGQGRIQMVQSDLYNEITDTLELIDIEQGGEPDEPLSRSGKVEELVPLFFYHHKRPYGPLGSYPWRTGSKT